MNHTPHHGHSPLHTILISLMMSFVFLASPPFERNVQQCEMIRVIGKKEDDKTD